MYDITPWKGLGPIEFGMVKDQIIGLLGEPTDIESMVSGDPDLSPIEVLHYDELGLSFEFEFDIEYELITIAISEGNYTLADKPILGISFEELIQNYVALGYTVFNFENLEKHIPDEEESVYSIETGIKCWIEDKKVVELQFSCFEEEY